MCHPLVDSGKGANCTIQGAWHTPASSRGAVTLQAGCGRFACPNDGKEVLDGIPNLGRNAPRRPRFERRLMAQVKREATGIGPEEAGLNLEPDKTVLLDPLG